MASLTVKEISKRFGDVEALSRVDLDVEDGAFCVLLGPSGCGKSTLLQIVAGLEIQDGGSVWLDGRRVDPLSPRERDIAMVFQDYALYPHMTVFENLSFGLRMRGVGREKIRQKVLQTARLLGIEPLLERKPRQLSGGQRQRVAMGRALVRRPRLFLLDEPLSNLDARLRINVRVELKKLHQQLRTTIVYVTHDQVEAMTLGEKVVVMRQGRVLQIGPPEVIYGQPADTFVATFVGSPVMNMFRGKLVREAGRFAFRHPAFSLPVEDIPPALEGYEVEVGVRPEDMAWAHDEVPSLRAEVEMLSNVGADQYIHGRLGEEPITVRVPRNTVCRAGEVLPLHINAQSLHVFYKGKRVGPSNPA